MPVHPASVPYFAAQECVLFFNLDISAAKPEDQARSSRSEVSRVSSGFAGGYLLPSPVQTPSFSSSLPACNKGFYGRDIGGSRLSDSRGDQRTSSVPHHRRFRSLFVDLLVDTLRTSMLAGSASGLGLGLDYAVILITTVFWS
jgi:hypothetical protein